MLGQMLDSAGTLSVALEWTLIFLALIGLMSLSSLLAGMSRSRAKPAKRSKRSMRSKRAKQALWDGASHPSGRIKTGPPRM